MRQADTVILVLSHVLNKGVVDLLNEMRAHCTGAYKVVLLFDNTKGAFDWRIEDTDCFLFDLQSIEDLRYPGRSFAYDDKRRQESPYHKDVFAQDKKFVFFCAGGLRSALAAQTAQRMGLKPVAHMRGGFGAWKKSGAPVEEPAPKS